MTENKILILFASQTGNSEQIAQTIYSKLASAHSLLLKMDDFDLSLLEKHKHLIFVSSTTGDGDAPDNALKFWRNLRKWSKESLFKDISYTILGLGDTNYSNFGAHPKKIDKKVQEMGGVLFYPIVIADEVEGLENFVDPWIDGLLRKLSSISSSVVLKPLSEQSSDIPLALDTKLDELSLSSKVLHFELLNKITELSQLTKAPTLLFEVEVFHDSNCRHTDYNSFVESFASSSTSTETYSQSHPYCSNVLKAATLTTKHALKKCIYMESQVDWNYEPGDSIAILLPNSSDNVNKILKLFNLNNYSYKILSGTYPSHVPKSCSIYDLFTYYLDVTSFPSKKFLRIMGDHSYNVQEKKMLFYLCSKEGREEYSRLSKLGFIHFIGLFQQTLRNYSTNDKKGLGIEWLIALLAKLAPRNYSVACFRKNSVAVSFNVVDYEVELDGVKFHNRGLATGWMDDNFKLEFPSSIDNINMSSIEGIKLLMWPVPSHDFKPSPKVPMILIGPGTGIAPFMSFLDFLKAQEDVNEVHLFYGCRNRDNDFLFKHELKAMQKFPWFHLHQAVSREDSYPYKYVQDCLKANSSTIVDVMMEKNGKIYVCGDARNMAKDVQSSLVEIISETIQGIKRNEAIDQAMHIVFKWIEDKRYLKEIWS